MRNASVKDDWEAAVILDQQPQLILMPRGTLGFDFMGDYYEDVGIGNNNGFYDFLRSAAGAIIGLRYLPWPEAEIALEGAAEREGLVYENDGQMRTLLIFWGQSRNFDQEAPCDQCFGRNVIYRSKNSRKLAIGFAIDVLTAQEKATLKETAIIP